MHHQHGLPSAQDTEFGTELCPKSVILHLTIPPSLLCEVIRLCPPSIPHLVPERAVGTTTPPTCLLPLGHVEEGVGLQQGD